MSPTRIGVDIGATQVRMAQVDMRHGRAPRLLRHGSADLKPGAVRDGMVIDESAVEEALGELWRAHRPRSSDVIIGIGSEHTYVRELTVADAPADELRSSLRYVADELLPVSAEDCVLDFQPYGRRGTELEGLLVAAPEEVVNSLISAVEAAKLRVVGVDLNAFALVRALLRDERSRGTTALIDVGATLTQVVISQYLAPRLVRFVRFGGNDLTTALKQRLGLTDEQADAVKMRGPSGESAAVQAVFADHARVLVEAVSQSIGYHEQAGGAPVERIVLSGRASRLPGLGQYVATATSLPVSLADATQSLQAERLSPAEEAAMSVAVGLAVAA